MSTSKNDITGDTIATKNSSDAYRSGWDRIFGRRPTKDDLVTHEITELKLTTHEGTICQHNN